MQEMLRKLGCAPRFDTPRHPEASGMVERFNQTCKKMLHHVVQQHVKLGQRGREGVTWPTFEILGPLLYLGKGWS